MQWYFCIKEIKNWEWTKDWDTKEQWGSFLTLTKKLAISNASSFAPMAVGLALEGKYWWVPNIGYDMDIKRLIYSTNCAVVWLNFPHLLQRLCYHVLDPSNPNLSRGSWTSSNQCAVTYRYRRSQACLFIVFSDVYRSKYIWSGL